MPKKQTQQAPQTQTPQTPQTQSPQTTTDALLASISEINTNPYTIGLAFILVNLGGRFLVLSVTPAQEAFLQNIVFRPLLLFAIMFMGTRNLIVAFWLTITVLVFLHYLLNENSDWYLLAPHQHQQTEKAVTH